MRQEWWCIFDVGAYVRSAELRGCDSEAFRMLVAHPLNAQIGDHASSPAPFSSCKSICCCWGIYSSFVRGDTDPDA